MPDCYDSDKSLIFFFCILIGSSGSPSIPNPQPPIVGTIVANESKKVASLKASDFFLFIQHTLFSIITHYSNSPYGFQCFY